ncbi:MAG: signal peptidase II [Cyanobacteria bacterium P01_D01_bin.123]
MVKNRGFWLVALMGVVGDRVTKIWVEQTMELGQSIPLIPNVFQFTYIENTGAAWSLFQNSGGFLKWISLAVALGLAALAIFGKPMGRWEQAGYGFILAGAVGNGIDRFVSGAVVDFLDFVLIRFPIFNVADIAINVGVACLLLGLLLESKQPESKQLMPPSSEDS